ncbi:MAG: hypothetical protein IH950_12125 [Bacteroidetes bacterium]|nr:hypothetical protein [Bacteroidota bacterium]
MINIKQKQILVFLFVSALLGSCSESENPIVNKDEKQMELEIIPANKVIITWDSTIYQHSTNWINYIDTTAADSLANFFLNSTVLIEDIWYPNEETPCLFPIRPGSEVIIKLNKPDSLIFNYGFQNNDGGFPIGCFFTWRHYKYSSK